MGLLYHCEGKELKATLESMVIRQMTSDQHSAFSEFIDNYRSEETEFLFFALIIDHNFLILPMDLR